MSPSGSTGIRVRFWVFERRRFTIFRTNKIRTITINVRLNMHFYCTAAKQTPKWKCTGTRTQTLRCTTVPVRYRVLHVKQNGQTMAGCVGALHGMAMRIKKPQLGVGRGTREAVDAASSNVTWGEAYPPWPLSGPGNHPGERGDLPCRGDVEFALPQLSTTNCYIDV